VDFYLHQGRVFIGELTITPGAGRYVFDPLDWDEVLGAKFGWPEPGLSVTPAAPETQPAMAPPSVASTLD